MYCVNCDSQLAGILTMQNRGDGFDMNVVPAWNRGYTGRGVVVSILDDGIEKDHPDLKNNYVSIHLRSLLILPTKVIA
jgi:subtilisin family serine protease